MNEEILDAAYSLNISDEDIARASKVISPLAINQYNDRSHLGLKQLRVMSTPEYLFWASKLLLNLDMTPMHALVLEELWGRPFPMLIASRGFSKCVTANTWIITSSGYQQIKDLVPKETPQARQSCNTKVFGEKGYQDVDYSFYNGEKYTRIINTRSGRRIEVSTNHPLRTIHNGDIAWLEAKEQQIGNYLIVKRNIEWLADNKLSMKKAKELAATINKKTSSLHIEIFGASKKTIAAYLQTIIENLSSKTQSIQGIRIYCHKDLFEPLQLLFNIFGINAIVNSKTLTITDYDYGILKSIIDLSAQFKEFSATDVTEINRFVPLSLLKHLIYALLQYAKMYRISDKEYNSLSKLVNNLIEIKTVLTYSEAKQILDLFSKDERITNKPEYKKYDKILNYDYYYDEIISIDESYDKTYDVHLKSDHSYFSNGFISHNTFTMAQLALLKMRLIPGTQIVITGSGFRQARLVFEYMEKICNNAPVYWSTMAREDGPKREQDRLTFRVGDSYTYAIPIGDDGEKIRGLRANVTIVDEFNCVGPDTLVETKQGLIRIGDDIDHLQLDVITGDPNLPHEKPDRYIVTPPSEYYLLKLANGLNIKCSPWHQFMTKKGWKKPNEIYNFDYIEYTNYYKFPRNSPKGINKDIAYLMGLCLSNGDMRYKDKIVIHTKNQKVATKLMSVYRFQKSLQDENIYILKNEFIRNQFNRLGIGYFDIDRKKKKVPAIILRSNKKCVFAFLKGLLNEEYLDGDTIKINHKSQLLLMDALVLLSKLDINAKLRRYYNKGGETRNHTLILGKRATTRFSSVDPPKSYKRKKIRYMKVTSCMKRVKKIKLYDYHLPKTHSFYANSCRNHNSVPIHIYETVIANFGTVMRNPVQQVFSANRRNKLIKQGKWTLEMEMAYSTGQTNQQILSGTAGYAFQHFATYYERYKNIIMSGGDRDTLIDIVGEEQVDKINWKSFSIIKIPYELIPEGFMDSETIARAKATIESDSYKREFGTVFTKDSEGFFKRTLIESCVAKESNPIVINGESVVFSAKLAGDSDKKYVMGVDPAFKHDNLAIVIVEMHGNHSRVVYCWTINEKKHKAKVKAGIITEHDYWQYCVAKIRELVKNFNIVRIMMDSGGGGTTLQQALQAPRDSSLTAILEAVDPNKPKDSDHEYGLHILELCQFANNKWLSAANHGLKFDLEHKLILFPNFDAVEIAIAYEVDKLRIESQGSKFDDQNFELYDTLEDCVQEIEQLKDEMTNIIITRTLTNVERWDTPDVKTANRKGVLKKDRYSALLMANMGARNYGGDVGPPKYMTIGGIVGQIEKHKKEENGGIFQKKPQWWNPGFVGIKIK